MIVFGMFVYVNSCHEKLTSTWKPWEENFIKKAMIGSNIRYMHIFSKMGIQLTGEKLFHASWQASDVPNCQVANCSFVAQVPIFAAMFFLCGNFQKPKRLIEIPLRIHGTGIFTYISHKNPPNVGKCAIHGYGYRIVVQLHPFFGRQISSSLNHWWSIVADVTWQTAPKV